MAQASLPTSGFSDVEPLDRSSDRRSEPRDGDILLIEDQDDVRDGLAQLLELHGFNVIAAPDADHGLRELDEQSAEGVALIILDLLLPGRASGGDFRAMQLADPLLASIPTIIITASDVDGTDRAKLQADGWLDKPFRFDSLLQLVKRYVALEAA